MRIRKGGLGGLNNLNVDIEMTLTAFAILMGQPYCNIFAGHILT